MTESRIKTARETAGLDRKDLCEATGIPLRTLENYEGGQRKPSKWVEDLLIEKIKRQAYMDMLRCAIRTHNIVAARYWSRPSEDGMDYQDMIDDLPDPDMSEGELIKWALMQAAVNLEQESNEMREYIKAHA